MPLQYSGLSHKIKLANYECISLADTTYAWHIATHDTRRNWNKIIFRAFCGISRAIFSNIFWLIRLIYVQRNNIGYHKSLLPGDIKWFDYIIHYLGKLETPLSNSLQHLLLSNRRICKQLIPWIPHTPSEERQLTEEFANKLKHIGESPVQRSSTSNNVVRINIMAVNAIADTTRSIFWTTTKRRI